MLNSVQHVQAVEETTPVLLQLERCIADVARRIRAGEHLNATDLAEAAGCGSTALNKTMKQLTQMTPGKFINQIQTETAIQLLLNPIKRRHHGLEATCLAIAQFVGWEEKTLRTNVKRQTNVLPELFCRNWYCRTHWLMPQKVSCDTDEKNYRMSRKTHLRLQKNSCLCHLGEGCSLRAILIFPECIVQKTRIRFSIPFAPPTSWPPCSTTSALR